MSRVIPLCVVGYGLFGSAVLLGYLVALAFGAGELPTNVTGLWTLFVLHGTAALLTFQRPTGSTVWRPLITPTPRRRALGRGALLASCVLLICSAGVVGLAGMKGESSSSDRPVMILVISVLLVQTVYFVVHWTLRPDNVFSQRVLKVASNPIGAAFIASKRRSP